MGIKDAAATTGGCLLMAVVLFLGLAYAALGWAGIEHHLGWWWGLAAVALAVVFRFTIPLAIGVFFGAKDVLEWHWFFAAIVAFPGLLVLIPGVVAAVVGSIRRR